MILFIVCSLIGGFCERPPIPAPSMVVNQPTVEVVNVPELVEDDGPFLGLGQPWVSITDKDTGHCPDYTMPSGSGGRPYLSWPIPGGSVRDNRGYRVGHTGIDIDAAEGTPVSAAASGTVVWAGVTTWCGTGCQVVAISHGGGWFTLYFHLSAVFVVCGQWIGSGSIIGTVGQTGAATWPHLHWELRNGQLAHSPT